LLPVVLDVGGDVTREDSSVKIHREGSARSGVIVRRGRLDDPGLDVKRLKSDMTRLNFVRAAAAAVLCGAALLAPQAASATVESPIVVGGPPAGIGGGGGNAQPPQGGGHTITVSQVAHVITAGVPVAKVISARRLAASQRLPAHVDRLYRAAWALCGSPHDAEDLVQETFTRVLARPRRLRRDDELPYLLTTLRNTYLTGLRTQGRRPETVELPADESQTMRSALADPQVALEQRELLATIAALPDDFRQALIAVDVVGLSYREAGRLLGVREATVTTRLYRARQRIARTLSTAPALAGDGRPAPM
jgi:RNA polymerase sigma-70 factor, ECF subfamily